MALWSRLETWLHYTLAAAPEHIREDFEEFQRARIRAGSQVSEWMMLEAAELSADSSLRLIENSLYLLDSLSSVLGPPASRTTDISSFRKTIEHTMTSLQMAQKSLHELRGGVEERKSTAQPSESESEEQERAYLAHERCSNMAAKQVDLTTEVDARIAARRTARATGHALAQEASKKRKRAEPGPAAASALSEVVLMIMLMEKEITGPVDGKYMLDKLWKSVSSLTKLDYGDYLEILRTCSVKKKRLLSPAEPPVPHIGNNGCTASSEHSPSQQTADRGRKRGRDSLAASAPAAQRRRIDDVSFSDLV